MSVATTRGLGDRIGAQYGPALWALAGFVLYVVGGMVMLFVSLTLAETALGSLGIDSQAGTLGLSIRNAAHPIGWGVFVAAVSMPIGIRLVPGLRFGAASWVVLVTGLALASLATFLGIEFVRARYEYFDPEYMGLSFFTSPALVAIALAAWATFAVPRGAAAALAGTLLTAAAGFALSLLPSIEGARDGIDPASMPLVTVLALAVGYVAVVSVVVVVRMVRAGR